MPGKKEGKKRLQDTHKARQKAALVVCCCSSAAREGWDGMTGLVQQQQAAVPA